MFELRIPNFTAPEGIPRRARPSPTCRTDARANPTGPAKSLKTCGPAPESVGATKSRSLSISERSRNAVAIVGPPSSSSDWTPSWASARSSSTGSPERSSSSEPSGQRPEAERDPPRLTLGRDVARVELRVVGAHGAHPHPDRVRLRAQLVHEPPRLFARDPTRAGDRHPPVERDRRLVRHERPLEGLPRPPRFVLASCLPQVEHLDLHVELAQPLDPCLRRVVGPDDDLRDPRADDRVDARRRPAEPRARLERRVERCPRRASAGHAKRDHLRVRSARVLVPALADHRPSRRDDDRPDDGVRARCATPSLGELERPFHVAHANACTKRR